MTDLPSDREPPRRAERSHGPAGSAEASLERIWRRIRRPIDAEAAVQALVGIPRRTARQVVGATIAGGSEASALIDQMPELVRNLSISTVTVPERCVGELRGPVLWSETLSARASSAGDPGVFVCSTVGRGYDTPENRLLVTALEAVVRGGRGLERVVDEDDDEPELLRSARRNAERAQRYLEHRILANVRTDQSRRRAIRRVRHDPRRRSYRHVAEVLARAAEPLDVATIRLFCNELTTARHDLFVAVVDHLEQRGIPLPDLLVVDRQLVAGPLRFHHPALGGADRPPTGLFVGDTRLDVPGGGAPEGAVVVHGRGDLITAVDREISRGSI